MQIATHAAHLCTLMTTWLLPSMEASTAVSCCQCIACAPRHSHRLSPPAGNRFPQIEANLKKCGRILRDKDWDAASSCSSSSGPDGLDRQPGSRCYLQALQLQLRGLSKAVKRQQVG